ncbi:MAG: bifunctional riboflavin kinase/FAD synthetase [Clostridia bacterium]|nr:bifunctional riboflavin kinase/FAD synthetase [Clostridia bacterium]
MKIYSDFEKIEYAVPCIALGNFDGMHLGHLEVLSAAKEHGESFGALLFDVHSAEMLGGGVKVITSLDEKLSVLSEIGADFAVIVSFDESFKNKSCREFAEYLAKIGVKAVSVGYDYRCGKGASADCNELKLELEKLGLELIISSPVEVDGIVVKSSRIRGLISCGDISAANRLLTRAYSVFGKVTTGKQNGRLMGFPTANIEVPANRLLPKDGVYYGECMIDKRYRVILNVGKNPTFNAGVRTVEAHIIGFSGDLYGEELRIELFERIRDCKRFNSPEELAKQLESDREYALNREQR